MPRISAYGAQDGEGFESCADCGRLNARILNQWIQLTIRPDVGVFRDCVFQKPATRTLENGISLEGCNTLELRRKGIQDRSAKRRPLGNIGWVFIQKGIDGTGWHRRVKNCLHPSLELGCRAGTISVAMNALYCEILT